VTLIIRTIIAAVLLLPFGAAQAQPDRTITIAYTTDIHDHLLPGPGGVGGFASVATFIDGLRAQNRDLILVDSGDTAEKGDLAAYMRHGTLTYDLMRQAGYNMGTIGNHEENFGLDRILDFDAHSGHILAAANLRDRNGNLLLQPFRIVGKKGVRVGIIGASLTSLPGPGPRGISTANNLQETALLIRDYAALLRARHDVDLVVVVTHAGLGDVRKLAAVEPDVDVIFAGHSHRVIEKPVVVNRRGTVVVQAGSFANYVGVLQATAVDGHWKISNRVVSMDQTKYPPQPEVMNTIKAIHAELGYDPMVVVGKADKTLGSHSIARLAAAALRDHHGVDIAFIHPGWIVRNIIPAGPLTTNDVFKAMADRAEALVRLNVTGTQINYYLNELANKPDDGSGGGWGQTLGVGFRVVSVSVPSPGGRRVVTTDLQPDRSYSVIMTRREWVWRFSRLFKEEGRELPQITSVEGGTFKILADYVRKSNAERPLSEEAARLKTLYGQADPDEALLERRFIAEQTVSPGGDEQ
jgi:5'-nucleotidase